MRLTQRYLILGLAMAVAPIVNRRRGAPGGRRLHLRGGSTVCAQGDVRGADGVPRAATADVPYPCENDWYCGTDWDLNVGIGPVPASVFPGVPVASDHVDD